MVRRGVESGGFALQRDGGKGVQTDVPASRYREVGSEDIRACDVQGVSAYDDPVPVHTGAELSVIRTVPRLWARVREGEWTVNAVNTISKLLDLVTRQARALAVIANCNDCEVCKAVVQLVERDRERAIESIIDKTEVGNDINTA